MVVESFPNVLNWLFSGLFTFLALVISGGVLGIIFGFLVASFRHGPIEGFYSVAGVLASAPGDFLGTSYRRTWAISRLAVKEALRRRVILVTFLIFASMLLFSGWFLTNVEHPERVYVNFVMFGTQLLVLLVGLLISAFSLPEDIKNHTIFTVVTKPVRATEIVIGRILGFGIVVTGLLLLMGIVSYIFVWRGLSHTHQVAGDRQAISSLSEINPDQRLNSRGGRVSDNAVQWGETTFDDGHRHDIELIEDVRNPSSHPPLNSENILESYTRADGKVVYRRVMVQPSSGHTHSANVSGSGESATIELGNSAGYFRARRPIYSAGLDCFDSSGTLGGTNIGKEWNYRSFIDGGTPAVPETLSRAEFNFENLTRKQFPDGESLVIEMTPSIFRTFVGDIQKRVIASLQFESIPEDPETEPKLQSEPMILETREMTIQSIPISDRMNARRIAPDGTILESGIYGLFEDFAGGKGNRLKVILRCEDLNQYIGVARADLYFRGQDDVFWWNFVKGYLGLWAQMMVVVSIGVALSTFLSTPVTILGSLVIFLIGFCTPFIRKMLAPTAEGTGPEGGGPIESFLRIIRQENMVSALETNWFNTVIVKTDELILVGLNSLTYLAPSFSDLDFSRYLTYGYSISNDRIMVAILIALAFFAGSSLIGYFTLKTREIAGNT